MSLGSLFDVVLKPFKSHPLVGAIGFGWALAAICDNLVRRTAFKQVERPALRAVTQQEYDSIYGEAGCSGQPRLQDFNGWPDSPCLLRWHPDSELCPAPGDGPVGLRINSGRAIEVDNELFKGSLHVWVEGLDSTPPRFGEEVPPPAPRSRITVQGRFKEGLPFASLLTGQEFSRPARHLPVQWLVEKVLLRVLRHLSPSTHVGPLSKFHLLTPVVSNTQYMHVGDPGSEPDPSGPPVEDLRLLGHPFIAPDGKPLANDKRMQLLGDAELRRRLFVDTERIWTFTIYQHQVDLSTYELIALKKWDLAPIFDGQPLQFMMRTDKQYLFKLQLWHKRLLPYAQRSRQLQLQAEQTQL